MPAIVDEIVAQAGWAREHHRRNACDTVARWSRHQPIRLDLPPAVRAAMTRNAPTSESLEELTRKLRLAIEQAKDGVTTIRAGCGLGKTRCSEQVAIARAQQSGEHKPNTKTVIAVPTNELAIQVAKHIQDAGIAVMRLYGPASVKGPWNGHECRFHDSASELAKAKLSIRWELCDGHNKTPCQYREICKAADGIDGSPDARVIIGNHGLLHELTHRTGITGLMVIDEPPSVLEETIISKADLELAWNNKNRFDDRYNTSITPILECVKRWLEMAPLNTSVSLRDALTGPNKDLLDQAFEATGATNLIECAEFALDEKDRTPGLSGIEIISCRTSPMRAKILGTTIRVCESLRRALTDASMRATIHDSSGGQRITPKPERKLALTGLRDDLVEAMRRDGRTVLMAADVHLYASHIEQVLGYKPHSLELRAPDGCSVRRCIIRTRKATRTECLVRGKKPLGLLSQSLELATGRVLVVTYLAMVGWVKEHVPPDTAVAHYGALRGLDTWQDFDTLITLGDPVPNLDAVARSIVDDSSVHDRGRALACSELEQSHGRLRAVHRTKPCTMIHVGSLLPDGWQGYPVENYEPQKGRVSRDSATVPTPTIQDVRRAIDAVGDLNTLASRLGVTKRTIYRWLTGVVLPDPRVLSVIA